MNFFERFDKLEEADRLWHKLRIIEEQINKYKHACRKVPYELYEQRDIYDKRLRDAINEMRI